MRNMNTQCATHFSDNGRGYKVCMQLNGLTLNKTTNFVSGGRSNNSKEEKTGNRGLHGVTEIMNQVDVKSMLYSKTENHNNNMWYILDEG